MSDLAAIIGIITPSGAPSGATIGNGNPLASGEGEGQSPFEDLIAPDALSTGLSDNTNLSDGSSFDGQPQLDAQLSSGLAIDDPEATDGIIVAGFLPVLTSVTAPVSGPVDPVLTSQQVGDVPVILPEEDLPLGQTGTGPQLSATPLADEALDNLVQNQLSGTTRQETSNVIPAVADFDEALVFARQTTSSDPFVNITAQNQPVTASSELPETLNQLASALTDQQTNRPVTQSGGAVETLLNTTQAQSIQASQLAASTPGAVQGAALNEGGQLPTPGFNNGDPFSLTAGNNTSPDAFSFTGGTDSLASTLSAALEENTASLQSSLNTTSTQATPTNPVDPALSGQLQQANLTPPHQNAATTHAALTYSTTAFQEQTLPALTAQISRNVAAGREEFRVQLHPAELGRIDVRLANQSDGSVQARIIVERSETLDLFQRDSRALERALTQSGLKLSSEGIDLSLSDSTTDGGSSQQAFDRNLGGDEGQNQNSGLQGGDDDSDAGLNSGTTPLLDDLALETDPELLNSQVATIYAQYKPGQLNIQV